MPPYLSRLERAVADAAPAFFCRLGGGVERPAEGVVAAEPLHHTRRCRADTCTHARMPPAAWRARRDGHVMSEGYV